MTSTGLRLTVPGQMRPHQNLRVNVSRILILTAALLTAAVFLLPAARNGAISALNRLMDASEAVNAYAYRRIPAGSPVSEGLGGILPAAAAACLAGALAIRARKAFALAAAVLCAGVQFYFGLSLPAVWNVALFTALGILTMDRITLRRVLCLTGAAAVLAGAVAIIRPGVDAQVETVSERVRDLLEPAAEQASGGIPDAEPDTIRETRHTDPRALTEGSAEAKAERRFRLVTVEEEQISRPEWIDYLKIVLLLLAAAAAVIFPFIPVAALNRRRKKAREARAAFDSPDRSEAICAMFRHTGKYLEKTGHGGGNKPFRDWPAGMTGNMPEKYVDSFQKCCILFEEAAYSDHEMTEAQAGQVRELLAETERLLYDQAGWRQRMRLRYAECLHE